MPDYLDLLRRRAAGQRTHTGTLRLLVDDETHASASEQLAELEPRLAKAQADLDMAMMNRDRGSEAPQRMNSISPVKAAQDALDEVQRRIAEARRAAAECFVTLHLSAPTGAEVAAATADGTDDDHVYPALVRSCLLRVTDHEGVDLPELTPDVIAEALPNLPFPVYAEVKRWFDKSVNPVDFPTLPASSGATLG